jgi:23S rRNA-intervening sequence protein
MGLFCKRYFRKTNGTGADPSGLISPRALAVINKENKNFCYFSPGSLIETKGWINKAKTRALISENRYAYYFSKLNAIHLKLNAYIKFIVTQQDKDQ